MNQTFNWKFFEGFTVALFQFAILLVFVRFVAPNEMGLAIICLAIFHIVNSLFVNSLSNVLLQKDEVDELDYSTTVISQLVLATIFYLLLYGSAAIVASWLQSDVIAIALRIVGVTLFFYAVSSLYKVHMIRTVNYSALFFINVCSAMITAIICFFLAIFQYGLFAVLLWTFFYQFFSVLLMVLFYKWRPQLRFSYQRLSANVTDGWKLMVTSGVSALLMNGQRVAIGLVFNPAALSFYVRGERIPGVFTEQFTQTFRERLVQRFGKLKDDMATLYLKLRDIVVLSGFIMFPLLTLLFVTADGLVLLLFGERWLMVVPFIRIFCVYYALLSVSYVFSQAMEAMQSADEYNKLDLMKKGILLLLWLISFPFGLQAVAGSMVVFIVISLFLNRFYLKKYINYSSVQLLKDLAPAFVLSCTMGILIYLLHYILPSSIILIVFQFILGALFYGVLAYFLKLQAWNLFVTTAKAFYRRISRKKLSAT